MDNRLEMGIVDIVLIILSARSSYLALGMLGVGWG